MARYDYRCTSCGNVFEVEHGMPDVREHKPLTSHETLLGTVTIVRTNTPERKRAPRVSPIGHDTRCLIATGNNSKEGCHHHGTL